MFRKISFSILIMFSLGVVAAEDTGGLEQAYKKEFAFLQAQQRVLKQRIGEVEASHRKAKVDLDTDLKTLESEFLLRQQKNKSMRKLLDESERTMQSNVDSEQLLNATFSQARTSFEKHGVNFSSVEEKSTPNEKLEKMYGMALDLIRSLATIKVSDGEFFGAGGNLLKGKLIEVGSVATYGVSDEAGGVLVPAGEGRLKLWREPNADIANALLNEKSPTQLPIFLYESKLQDIELDGEKGIWETVDSGGVIAWVIVLLGVVASVLIALRVKFLRAASTDSNKLALEVAAFVQKRDLEGALAHCKSHKGATSRVVASAIRNLHRDRDHLEDIVSESILHESSYLDRFGSLILVLAAISPLLGLLGTVTGMISTFDVITEYGTGDPKLLSGGISIALVTTEVGLVVAIPVLLLGNMLSGWAERIKTEMERLALHITNIYQDTELAKG